jgi:hypothetical protein
MSQLLTRLRTTLASSPTEPPVHFHNGSAGPYVCENTRCTSPHLSDDDIWAQVSHPSIPGAFGA